MKSHKFWYEMQAQGMFLFKIRAIEKSIKEKETRPRPISPVLLMPSIVTTFNLWPRLRPSARGVGGCDGDAAFGGNDELKIFSVGSSHTE